MPKLPYSRVVNVTMTRNDRFPSRRGFGTPLLLTNVSVAGQLDGTFRTKLYSSMEEVAVDHLAATDFYSAAEAAFSQNPRPLQIKGGFVTAATPGTITAADMKTQLDGLYDYDNEWYWMVFGEKEFRDAANLNTGVIEWIQAKPKIAILDTNAVGHETSGNTTVVSAVHKGTVDRTATFYHTDVNEFGGAALAAVCSINNFDQGGSAYTAKFKKLRSVSPINKNSAAVQAITGFTPEIGQATGTGHMANTYIDIGGQSFVTEGSTLTPNVFIDEIHATDWIIARTEEEMLGILLNNKRVPFTDAGMFMLASGPKTVMSQARTAGIIAEDLNVETGRYEPSVTYEVPSAISVPESQRKNRIAPAISVRFRYAGAVHYTTINYYMTF